MTLRNPANGVKQASRRTKEATIRFGLPDTKPASKTSQRSFAIFSGSSIFNG